MAATGMPGRGVAVVGAGMSEFGIFAARDTTSLWADAFLELCASVDRGLDAGAIQAAFVGNFTNDFFVGQSHWGPILADTLGLTPIPVTRVEGACASGALAFRHAAIAIASGYYDIVLVGGFEEMSKQATESVADGLAMAASPYERNAGFTFPGLFGAMATAYFDRYKASRDDLMKVTIKSHLNGARNVKAQHQQTIAQIMASKRERAQLKGLDPPDWDDEEQFLSDPKANPPIAWPMHLFDCSPISDGAACLLLVADELAASFTERPVFLKGMGQASGHALHEAPKLTVRSKRRR